MPLVNPLAWATLTYGDETAWIDFLGAHALWHDQLDYHIRARLHGPTIPSLPLGDGGGAEWTQAHQDRHDGECDALGIPRGPDFQSYDLKQADQFVSFCFIHAQECQRLAQAAGA